MKFIVTSTELQKHLQLLSGVLNNNSNLPILDNFLFDIAEGNLTVTVSNLETTMITTLPVRSEENGQIAIPAKLLLDTLKTFPEYPLTFTINEENLGVEISSGSGKYKLTGADASEFPRNPEIEDSSSVSVPAEVLAEAIQNTIFATGSEDMRLVMSGVFFELSSDYLRFVATDAHKLVRYTRSDAKSDRSASFIVPKKPLNHLKNILSGTNAEVKMEYNDTNLKLSFDNVIVISRLIEGKFPNYEAVIPTENPSRLVVDRQALLNSVRRVSIFSNKTTHQVRLKITGSELFISAEDLDFANEANERLDCSFEGEDMEIGFNARFLMDMLANIHSAEVVMELSKPNRAGILMPAVKDNEAEDVLMLVMPVTLNS